MTSKFNSLAIGLLALMGAGAACAQSNIIKLGLTNYTTNSTTDGITGIGVPAGANAETGDAFTTIVAYERMLTPNLGAELVLGMPPHIKADAKGSVAYLGNDVLSANNVSPTAFLNIHFGEPGDTWRPYIGLGFNYTKFTHIESSLAEHVEMSDSKGWAAALGMNYAINNKWGVFGSVVTMDVKSKLVATGSTVLQTTIEFRPTIYTMGVAYKF